MNLKGNVWAELNHKTAVLVMRALAKIECKNSGLRKKMTKEADDLYGFEAIGETMKNLLPTESFPKIKKNLKIPVLNLRVDQCHNLTANDDKNKYCQSKNFFIIEPN